ncbi:MAG: hypothetical protein ABUL58_01565 [Steroidobacter sp.]
MNTDISFPYNKKVPTARNLRARASSREESPAALPMTMNPVLTRVAVDLTMPKHHASSATIQPYLSSLQQLMSLDCIFVALFGADGVRVEWVAASSNRYEHCNPYELVGTPQPCNAELLHRLSRHQLLDVRDCTHLRGEYAEFSGHMLRLNLCSLLVGGIVLDECVSGIMVFGSLHRRQGWDMDTHLIMKLMTASYAAGYERYQHNH